MTSLQTLAWHFIPFAVNAFEISSASVPLSMEKCSWSIFTLKPKFFTVQLKMMCFNLNRTAGEQEALEALHSPRDQTWQLKKTVFGRQLFMLWGYSFWFCVPMKWDICIYLFQTTKCFYLVICKVRLSGSKFQTFKHDKTRRVLYKLFPL